MVILAKIKNLGKCLYDLYDDPKTLFVISSDFCYWRKEDILIIIINLKLCGNRLKI